MLLESDLAWTAGHGPDRRERVRGVRVGIPADADSRRTSFVLLRRMMLRAGTRTEAIGGATGEFHNRESVTLVAPFVPTATTVLAPRRSRAGHEKNTICAGACAQGSIVQESSTESQLA